MTFLVITAQKMISALKTSIDKRLSIYEYGDTYVTSAVLDPRFEVRWCNEEKVDELLSVVKQKASQVETATQDSSCPVEEDLSPPRKMIDMRDMTATTEPEAYLAEPCSGMESDPMDYWKVSSDWLSVLSKLASKYRSIPATSALLKDCLVWQGKLSGLRNAD